MQEETLVSVCIPVYNREKFIKAAVESVLSQTYQHFEVIIVDDGSTDASVSVVKTFDDPRIKLFQNGANKGVVYTRNRYLEEASGEYIAILDSDDIWLPTKLEKQINFFVENEEYGLCGTWALRKYSSGKEYVWKYPVEDEEIRVRMMWGSSMIHSSMMIKTSILKNNSISYNKDFSSGQDYDILRRLIHHTKAYNLPEVLLIYNIHGDQITVQDNFNQVRNSMKTGESYLNDLGLHLSAMQREAYGKVFSYKYGLSLKELEGLRQLFEKLLSVGKKNSPYYHFLKNNLAKQWFLACYFSTKNGLNTLKIFNSAQQDFPYPLNIFQKGKFYLKCLQKK